MTAPVNTTVDTETRIALCSQPWAPGKDGTVVVHWVNDSADAIACGRTKGPRFWFLEHGSSAAISCPKCRRAFEKERRGL